MSESYWCKTLLDGSIEHATDSDIKQGLASWTRGRQDIDSVKLFFAGVTVMISPFKKDPFVPLEGWKQYDNFVFRPSDGSTKRISREVSCKVGDYKFFMHRRDIGYVYKQNSIVLNNESGIPIPSGTTVLVCRIEIDGTVSVKWR